MDRGAPRPIGKSHSLQWTTFGSRKRQELNRSNLLRSEGDKIRHVFGLQYLTTRRLSAGVASLNCATERHAGPDDLQLISSRLLRSARERAVHAALHCAPRHSD
jgi:hypothetical protein